MSNRFDSCLEALRLLARTPEAEATRLVKQSNEFVSLVCQKHYHLTRSAPR